MRDRSWAPQHAMTGWRQHSAARTFSASSGRRYGLRITRSCQSGTGGLLRAGIARGEQHLQAGAHLARSLGELEAGQPFRHGDVGEQQIDRRAGTQQGQGGRAMLRGQHRIAQEPQMPLGHLAHLGTVVDHQDRLVPGGQAAGRHLGHGGVVLAGDARQEDAHRGPDPHLAVDLQVSAGLPDEPVDHAETQAAAARRAPWW